MGGPGGPETTTPEDLFAAGYAACFGSASEHVARLKKIPHKGIKIAAEVTIGTAGPGFALAVKLDAAVSGVPSAGRGDVAAARTRSAPTRTRRGTTSPSR